MSFAGLSLVLSTHAAQFEAVAFKGDLEANLAKIAGWGYTGVELAIRDPTMVDAEKLIATLKEQGLKVPAIGTGQAWGEEGLSFTHPDGVIRRAAIERIKRQIQLAQQLGALVIIGLIRGVTASGQDKTISMSYLVEALQECGQAAATQGVRLALEPLNRYETDLVHTVGEGLELLNRVGADNIGLLLDTFHMNIEEPDIIDSIRKASQRVFHVHVADSNRWYPGAGHLDFKSILKALSSAGYRGWISGEFLPLPDPNTAARKSISELSTILSSS